MVPTDGACGDQRHRLDPTFLLQVWQRILGVFGMVAIKDTCIWMRSRWGNVEFRLGRSSRTMQKEINLAQSAGSHWPLLGCYSEVREDRR